MNLTGYAAHWLRRVRVKTRLYLLSSLPLLALLALILVINARQWQQAKTDRALKTNLEAFHLLADAIQQLELSHLSRLAGGDVPAVPPASRRNLEFIHRMPSWSVQGEALLRAAASYESAATGADETVFAGALKDFRTKSYFLSRKMAEELAKLTESRRFSENIRHYLSLKITRDIMNRVRWADEHAPGVLIETEEGEALIGSVRRNLGFLTAMSSEGGEVPGGQAEQERLAAVQERGETLGLTITQEDVALRQATPGALYLVKEYYQPKAEGILHQVEPIVWNQVQHWTRRTKILIGGSLAGSLIAILFAFVLTQSVYRSIVDPLKDLADAAGKMEHGEAVRNLDTRSRDEIGEVAKGFNSLTLITETLEDEFSTLAKAAQDGNLQIRGDTNRLHGQWGRLVNGMNRTLDQLEAAHAKLRNTQRMEVYAKMSGGIAHQFNNLLTVIIGNVELQQECEADPSQELETVLQAARRAQSLVAQLRTLGTERSVPPGSLSLHEALKQLGETAQQLLPDKIQTQFISPPEDIVVTADGGTLQQAFAHLLNNVRDVLIDGGALVVEAKPYQLGEKETPPAAWAKPGGYAMIRFQDNGPGLSPVELAHVFEPFFTTKDPGSNSGLGLSMVYGFTKQCGGWCAIQSEPGKGTEVILYLPEAKVPVAHETEVSPVDVPASNAERKALLVEDDLLVCRLTHTMLKKLGYTVVEAHDGKEGLEALETHHQELSVIVSDVLMPHLTGPQMIKQFLRDQRLSCGVLFVTGYSAEELPAQMAELGGNFARLNKPFNLKDLESSLNDLVALPA